MKRNSFVIALMTGICLVGSNAASASELTDMVGTWKWTDYVIEVQECATNPSGAKLCAIVQEGPQNKGMEMIRSQLEKKGSDFVGQIAHPATGDIYNTRMTYQAPDTWHMDGCTSNGVCAQGDFVRLK